VGRLLVWAVLKKENKQVGWAEKEKWVRVGCFVFFNSFSLISFSNFYSKPFQKILNKLLTTQSIQKPMHST
jgi:hypothetical protein